MRALRPLGLSLAGLSLWFGLRGEHMRVEFEAFRTAIRLAAAGDLWPLRWPVLAGTPADRPDPVPPPAAAAGPRPQRPEPASDVREVAPRSLPPAAASPSPVSGPQPGPARAHAWPPGAPGGRRGRLSLSAWSLIRGSGPVGPGVSPVLGGGQSGLTLAYAPDPQARRPLAAIVRLAVPHRGAAAGAQAALGLRWRPVRGVALDAERLIPLGDDARAAWTLRAAGGAATPDTDRLRFDASAYGEAGIVGLRARDAYAAGLAHAGVAAPVAPELEVGAGIGVWGSAQRAGGVTLGRLDAGPSLRARLRSGPATIRLVADYRWRLTGDAEPGSGPALTIAVDF